MPKQLVDDAHTLTRDRPEERREPGLIYRFAAMQIYASGFAVVALGAARSALDAFIDLARGKTPALTQTGLRDSAVIQSAIGIADAKLKSARTWLIQVLRETQEAVKLAGELVEPAVLVSPEYVAVIECVPVDRLAVWHEALSLLSVTALQPGKGVLLSLKATVPVAALLLELTVALELTFWPYTLAEGEGDSDVVLDAGPIVSITCPGG